MNIQAIKTASELIDRFGGTTETAKMYGVRPSAASNWRRTGFPPRLHLRVLRDATARGLILDPNFFDSVAA